MLLCVLIAAPLGVAEEKPPPQSHASAVLCGETVDYDASDIGDREGFAGVWSGALWNGRVCGALIVEREYDDGTADVLYVYAMKGSPPASLRREAKVEGDSLSFDDPQGGHFTFTLDGDSLEARFVDARGRALTTTLRRE